MIDTSLYKIFNDVSVCVNCLKIDFACLRLLDWRYPEWDSENNLGETSTEADHRATLKYAEAAAYLRLSSLGSKIEPMETEFSCQLQ